MNGSMLTAPWVPRGPVTRWRATAAPGGTAGTSAVAWYADIGGGMTVVDGRLYRIIAGGRVNPSATSTTAPLIMRVHRGDGSGGLTGAGYVAIEMVQGTTGNIEWRAISDILEGGTDIAAGTGVKFTISAEAGTGTLTCQYSAGSLTTNTWLQVDDCGLA